MICSMMAPGAWLVSRKTEGNLPAALRRRSIGVVTITAPKVPPRTMMAAVSCATSFTLPCSSTKPPRMPPTASAKPPRVARSGRRPDVFFALFAGSGVGTVVSAMSCPISTAVRGLVGRRALPGRDRWTEQNAAVDGPAELHHPPDHLFGGFQHDLFLPGGQTDHCVGCHV